VNKSAAGSLFRELSLEGFGFHSTDAGVTWLPSTEDPSLFRSKETTLAFSLSCQDAGELGFVESDLFELNIIGAGGASAAGAASSPIPAAPARLRLGYFPLPADTDWGLANGWQCWSESPIVTSKGVLPQDAVRDRWVFGDNLFYPYAAQPGVFHSWFFSYCGSLARPGEQAFLGADGMGRIAIAFVYDLENARVAVDLDCEGLNVASDQAVVCRFVLPQKRVTDRSLAKDFAAWSNALHCRRPAKPNPKPASPLRGYTSWYHHYPQISADLLQRNAAASKSDMGIFQIDDGYQKSVGEWTELKPGFGDFEALRAVFETVRKRGMMPGLWLAPFVSVMQSGLLKSHPEWLLRDRTGAPIRVGHIPHWGGDFFALDTEREDYRAWLEGVIKFWTGLGVGFFKCDFLYAPGVLVSDAGGTMTRLERSSRAHAFLYDVIRKHGAKLLSCGAILDQAIHSCDYSRIGADVGQVWDDADAAMRWSREKVSTRAAITNTVTRAPLSGNGLLTDGDVTIVRSYDTDLSLKERQLLAWVNGWASDVQFVSCDLFAWDVQAEKTYSILTDASRLGPYAVESCGPAEGTRVEAGIVQSFGVRLRAANGEMLPLELNLNEASWKGLY
jgi:alpha-galactosidase